MKATLNGRVLLLNQTYEPLGTVSVARAIIMVFKNTVSVEELDGDRVLRSVREEFQVPSVVRRREYINIRRHREASGMKQAGELTLDHIFPRSRGGENSPVNIVTACLSCNNRKGARTPSEARMPLLTTQSALRVKLERVVLCHYAEARPEWKKYIFLDAHDDREIMKKVRSERARIA